MNDVCELVEHYVRYDGPHRAATVCEATTAMVELAGIPLYLPSMKSSTQARNA